MTRQARLLDLFSACSIVLLSLIVVYKAGQPSPVGGDQRETLALALVVLFGVHLSAVCKNKTREDKNSHDEDWIRVERPECPSLIAKQGCDSKGWRLEVSKDHPYLHNDHEFAHCKFYFDSELKSDLFYVQSRAKIPMKDDSVAGILGSVGETLERCHENHTHFPSLYDIREYELPGPRGAYARARQLVKWCGTYDQYIDKHIHSVAVIIPSGFGAKLLKNCVQFIIWATQPPMDPRIFEDNNGQGLADAREFLSTRICRYKERDLLCKPCEAGQNYSAPPSLEMAETMSPPPKPSK